MPPRGRRPGLRLVHKRGSPEDILLQATIHLSENRPEKAVDLYSEVLYKLSPASICALLSRSLAYSHLGLPELAVADAYRAGIVANQMRGDRDNGKTKYQAAAKYLRTEQVHVNNKEAWTTSRRRFVRGDWTYTALSSLVINDIPEFDDEEQTKEAKKEYGSFARFAITGRQTTCEALEVRAIYRLCGALYQCGGGARSDALGMIDDARRSCRGMIAWEWFYFEQLGNMIMSDVMQLWDDRYIHVRKFETIYKLLRRKQEEEQQRAKESMKAKTTSIKLSNYHWNAYEPVLDDKDWQQLLRSWVLKSSSNCAPYVVQHHDQVGNIWHPDAAPYAELRAERDINNGELVLSEQTVSNVTTSIPEDVFENESPSSSRRFYCDTCASLLLVPRECSVRYRGTKVPLPTPSPRPNAAAASNDSGNAAYGSGDASPENDPPALSQQESVIGRTPSDTDWLEDPSPGPSLRPEAPYPTPSDFMFCCPTHDVPTCSAACRKSREPFDPGLCHTSIERDLRNSHLLSPSTFMPLEDRKRQCLTDLLFLRLFAKAFNTRSNPLHDSDLVFATSGPTHQGPAGADEERTWNFTNNVVRPIGLLERFFESTQTDQFAQLEKCDGWILNTLLSKISKAMHVSTSPRYVKVFNQDSNIVSSYTPFDEAWHGTIHEDQPTIDEPAIDAGPLRLHPNSDLESPKDPHPSIGSLHPLFNLIRIANPEKGEKPNVVAVWREGVSVYVKSGDGAEPAIRRGEVLMRAVDDDDEEEGKEGEGEGMERTGGVGGQGEREGVDEGGGDESESEVVWEGEGNERDSEDEGDAGENAELNAEEMDLDP